MFVLFIYCTLGKVNLKPFIMKRHPSGGMCHHFLVGTVEDHHKFNVSGIMASPFQAWCMVYPPTCSLLECLDVVGRCTRIPFFVRGIWVFSKVEKKSPKTNMELVEETKDCTITTCNHQTYFLDLPPTVSSHQWDGTTCLGSGIPSKTTSINATGRSGKGTISSCSGFACNWDFGKKTACMHHLEKTIIFLHLIPYPETRGAWKMSFFKASRPPSWC